MLSLQELLSYMIALQIIAIVLAVVGIIGSIIPGLPGPPVSWVGMICAYFCKGTDSGGDPMSMTCLIIWLVITIVVTVLDYIVPAYLTKITGGHKAASWGSIIGLFVGLFIPIPFAMLIVSFLGAFVGELLFAKADTWASFKAACGTFLGFLAGTFMKLVVSVWMAVLVVIFAF